MFRVATNVYKHFCQAVPGLQHVISGSDVCYCLSGAGMFVRYCSDADLFLVRHVVFAKTFEFLVILKFAVNRCRMIRNELARDVCRPSVGRWNAYVRLFGSLLCWNACVMLFRSSQEMFVGPT